MPPTANRSRTRAMLVLAAFALALAAPAIEEAKAQSGEAVTQADCKTAWNSASARPTCSTTPNDILLSNGQCRIKKACQYYGPGPFGPNQLQHKSNDVTVPVGDVDDLHNCDGDLQVGSC